RADVGPAWADLHAGSRTDHCGPAFGMVDRVGVEAAEEFDSRGPRWHRRATRLGIPGSLAMDARRGCVPRGYGVDTVAVGFSGEEFSRGAHGPSCGPDLDGADPDDRPVGRLSDLPQLPAAACIPGWSDQLLRPQDIERVFGDDGRAAQLARDSG